MNVISVSHLKKYFTVQKRSSGFSSYFRSLFIRHMEQIKAIDDISFEIGGGELVGFIGPNGAGKTTTLKCLSGLLYPTGGKLSVFGYKPFDRKWDFLKGISLVMGQKNQLWWDLPALDTFRLNKEIYEITDSDYTESLNELTSLLDVRELLDIPVRKLSLGQRMKMELIAALLHRPKVLFLDEPTIGLDVVMQKKMRDFISKYNRRYKATVLLTSHYMTDVKELCKRVLIIDAGRIIYDGSLDRLIQKYAVSKIISVTFGRPVDDGKIHKLGKIKLYSYPKLILTVPRNKTNSVVATLLKEFPVEDLNIEHPEIEDIIRVVFNRTSS